MVGGSRMLLFCCVFCFACDVCVFACLVSAVFYWLFVWITALGFVCCSIRLLGCFLVV